MIFVTVGTTKFPFDRLLITVDKIMVKSFLKEKIIIQQGVSNYRFCYKNKKVFKEISFDKMIYFFKKARVVITSGGPASIFLALKYGKNKPLIVPRSEKFGEHVDDHEVLFGKFIKSEKNVEVTPTGKNLTKQISGYLAKPMVNSKHRELVASSQLIERLTNLTASYDK